MKKIVVSAVALSMLTSAAFAGSLVVPEMEPMVEVVPEEAGSSDSSGGLLVPLLALVAIGALIASSDSTDGT